MKIVSWNLNGLRSTARDGNFSGLFSLYKIDIACFQETKCQPEQLDDDVLNYKKYFSYFSFSKLRKGYSGVAIYSKIQPKKIEYGLGIKKFDDEGRLIIAYYEDFILINGYFPNGGSGEHRLIYKLEFYEAFLKFINKLKKNGHNVIICGDINTAHHEIDLARPKENSENTGFLLIERAWLDKVMKNDWVDVFRYFYPLKKDVYTYWDQKTRARERNVGWRIDYFLTNQSFVHKIKSFKTISNYYGSDHCPILIEVKD
jgi:exodeoxyribonuclease-3